MWKVVFNPTGSERAVDKDGRVCYPQDWAAGYSSVVDPLISDGLLVKVDIGVDRDHANPAVMLVADRVDELNAAIKADSDDKDSASKDSKKTTKK